MADSARSQLNGMAGLHTANTGNNLKTPPGFGAITSLFADMKRHFSGTWFVGIQNQEELNQKARNWTRVLKQKYRFRDEVIEGAMAEIVWRGDVAAPSLNTIQYLCQKKTDENNSGHNRAAAKAARDIAMAKIKQGEVIRG